MGLCYRGELQHSSHCSSTSRERGPEPSGVSVPHQTRVCHQSVPLGQAVHLPHGQGRTWGQRWDVRFPFLGLQAKVIHLLMLQNGGDQRASPDLQALLSTACRVTGPCPCPQCHLPAALQPWPVLWDRGASPEESQAHLSLTDGPAPAAQCDSKFLLCFAGSRKVRGHGAPAAALRPKTDQRNSNNLRLLSFVSVCALCAL